MPGLFIFLVTIDRLCLGIGGTLDRLGPQFLLDDLLLHNICFRSCLLGNNLDYNTVERFVCNHTTHTLIVFGRMALRQLLFLRLSSMLMGRSPLTLVIEGDRCDTILTETSELPFLCMLTCYSDRRNVPFERVRSLYSRYVRIPVHSHN